MELLCVWMFSLQERFLLKLSAVSEAGGRSAASRDSKQDLHGWGLTPSEAQCFLWDMFSVMVGSGYSGCSGHSWDTSRLLFSKLLNIQLCSGFHCQVYFAKSWRLVERSIMGNLWTRYLLVHMWMSLFKNWNDTWTLARTLLLAVVLPLCRWFVSSCVLMFAGPSAGWR